MKLIYGIIKRLRSLWITKRKQFGSKLVIEEGANNIPSSFYLAALGEAGDGILYMIFLMKLLEGTLDPDKMPSRMDNDTVLKLKEIAEYGDELYYTIERNLFFNQISREEKIAMFFYLASKEISRQA